MHPKDEDQKFRIYWRAVGSVAAIMLTLLSIESYIQESPKYWRTDTLRVQFNDGTDIEKHSGCYMMNIHIENSKRDVYFSDENNNNVGSFSYCRNTRRWTLLEGDNYDACDDNDYAIAYSAKTASSSSFNTVAH